MISSMIDQRESDVHIPGMPKPGNQASSFFWEALSSDGVLGWRRGEIRVLQGHSPDQSASLANYSEFKTNGVPSFFLDMLVSIDLEIPPAEEVAKMLDPHVFAISYDSPAFNIPSKAAAADLALCLVASRIAMECKARVISPTSVTPAETAHALQEIGLNALAVGGIGIYPLAKKFATSPYLWTQYAKSDTALEFGRDDDDR